MPRADSAKPLSGELSGAAYGMRTIHSIFRFSPETVFMVDIVKSGGWLMAPIILCAIIAMGILLLTHARKVEDKVRLGAIVRKLVNAAV